MALHRKKTSAKAKSAASAARRKAVSRKPEKTRKPLLKKPLAKAAEPEEAPESAERPSMGVRTPVRASAAEIEARLRARKEKEPEAEETSTEELWTLYRKEASKRGPKEPRKLEELRNLLIERHYPLVRYIAERLLQTLPK